MRSNLDLLLAALAAYKARVGSYFPVDETEIQEAIDLTRQLHLAIDQSDEARINRLFGDDQQTQAARVQTQKLVNLATALSDYDDTIYDALLLFRRLVWHV